MSIAVYIWIVTSVCIYTCMRIQSAHYFASFPSRDSISILWNKNKFPHDLNSHPLNPRSVLSPNTITVMGQRLKPRSWNSPSPMLWPPGQSAGAGRMSPFRWTPHKKHCVSTEYAEREKLPFSKGQWCCWAGSTEPGRFTACTQGLLHQCFSDLVPGRAVLINNPGPNARSAFCYPGKRGQDEENKSSRPGIKGFWFTRLPSLSTAGRGRSLPRTFTSIGRVSLPQQGWLGAASHQALATSSLSTLRMFLVA